jgi:hypothetical protein
MGVSFFTPSVAVFPHTKQIELGVYRFPMAQADFAAAITFDNQFKIN